MYNNLFDDLARFIVLLVVGAGVCGILVGAAIVKFGLVATVIGLGTLVLASFAVYGLKKAFRG